MRMLMESAGISVKVVTTPRVGEVGFVVRTQSDIISAASSEYLSVYMYKVGHVKL
jgi:hypothetical protein